MDTGMCKDCPGKAKFLKVVAGFLGILAIFLVVKIIGDFRELQYIGRDVAVQTNITVSGKGEVFAVPDVSTFTFSVMEEDKVVATAQEKVTTRMNAVLGSLQTLGVEEKDIQTTDYSVYPQYDYTQSICTQYSCGPSRQTLRGYQVSQTVSVKVRVVEDSGKILGEMGKLNVTNISGLNFTVDDVDALTREARQKAIEDAKEKAKMLAKDLGVKLGRVVNFSESGYQPYYFAKETRSMAMGMGGDMMEAPTPDLPVGQSKITSNVTIVYEIR